MGHGLLPIAFAALIVSTTLAVLASSARIALDTVSPTEIFKKARQGDNRAMALEAVLAGKDAALKALATAERALICLATLVTCGVFVAIFDGIGILYAVPVIILGWIFILEALPKAVARAKAEPLALTVAPLLRGTLAGKRAKAPDIPDTADAVRKDRAMLGGLLDLRELEVYDVMVHRTRMLALDADLPTAELVAAILESPYTRVPLYRDKQDNIIGVVHAKDLLRAIQKAHGELSRINLSRIAVKPWFVPDTTPVQAQLNAFLKRKSHFALVVDEYGEVQGLITLEDILEEIVGDIADEHDTVIEGVIKEPDGSYIVDGQLPIRDLNRALDWRLPDEEATTVAGLVIHEAKLIPEPGQQFTFHAVRFMVLSRSHNRVTQLRITPLAD